MATMNVSLPDDLKAWAESRPKTGNYANVSDYVRDVIRKDREREEKRTALMEKYEEGLRSGPSDRSVDEIFDSAIRSVDGR